MKIGKPSKHVAHVLSALLLSVLVQVAQGQETDDTDLQDLAAKYRHNAYSFAVSYGEHDAYATQAAASFAIGEKSTLDFSVGYNRSPRELEDTHTYRGDVGFDHDFDPIGFSVGYEYWGDGDFIDTHRARGSLYFHGDHGRIAALAEFRSIDLNFAIPPGIRAFVDDSKTVESTGFGLSARYKSSHFDLYGIVMTYDYDSDLNRLSDLFDLSRVPPALRPTIIQRLQEIAFNLRRLNASSMTLANSFLDESLTLGTDIPIGDKSLNIELAHEVIAIDGSEVNSASIAFMHPMGKSSDIEYRVGYSHDDVAGSLGYIGVAFYWYH